jgi:hypothetical protein
MSREGALQKKEKGLLAFSTSMKTKVHHICSCLLLELKVSIYCCNYATSSSNI